VDLPISSLNSQVGHASEKEQCHGAHAYSVPAVGI